MGIARISHMDFLSFIGDSENVITEVSYTAKLSELE